MRKDKLKQNERKNRSSSFSFFKRKSAGTHNSVPEFPITPENREIFFTPRSNSSGNTLIKEKSKENLRNGDSKVIFTRSKSHSTKKKNNEGIGISSPLTFSRPFFVSQDLKWEFKDKNDLEFVEKLGKGY